MDYISAEEFLKQPKKVQEVFIDWWQPEIGDLIYNFKFKTINFLDEDYKNTRLNKQLLTKFSILLFTEGQLRKLIEEKTECKFQVCYNGDCGYSIEVGYSDGFMQAHYDNYNELGHDLLQAYWQVACKIAKEEQH